MPSRSPIFFIEPLYRASPLVYRLVYTNLPEAFLAYIKLSLLLGLILSTPISHLPGVAFRFARAACQRKEDRRYRGVLGGAAL